MSLTGNAEFVGVDNAGVTMRHRCGSLTHVCCSLIFLSFLVFSVDHRGTFCTHLLLIVPGLLWYVSLPRDAL